MNRREAIRAIGLLTAGSLWACRRAPLPGVAAAESGPGIAAGVRYIERLTGGASSRDRLPLVVGMHGLGGSPDEYGHVLSTLSVPARVVLPYGINVWRAGYSWMEPGWASDDQFAALSRRAADRVAAMIAEIAKRVPTSGSAIVTGFSQGGMMSYALAVLHPEVVRAAFPVGGCIARPLAPKQWAAGTNKPRIRAFHGDADHRVYIEDDRGTVRRLKEAGLDVELIEYAGMGHTITPEMQQHLTAAIAEECM